MSEQALYETARRRIDQRNRRWTIWSVNLAVPIISLAALILLGSTPYADPGAAIFIGWGGIFTLHTIMAGLAESRAGSIENEVAKLRTLAQADSIYEKPKRQTRLELTDDGELLETLDGENEDEYAQRRRNS